MSFPSSKSNGSLKKKIPENISKSTINNGTLSEKNSYETQNSTLKILQNTIENYEIGKKLGEGTFSKVYIGTHKKTKEKVAIKIMSKNQIKEESDKIRIIKEINIHKRCHHTNIIQQYNIIETKNLIYIITEYASNGELFDYIVQKKKLYEIEACRLYNQLISGLEYLHKQRICHRDLKPENLLLDTNKILKIADFGLSTFYNKNNKNYQLKTPCGSPCYAAPEMVSGKKYNASQVDIWSSGIVLFTMVCGFLPFEDDNQKILFSKIARGIFNIPNFISSNCKDLIKKILVTDPKKRFSFEDIKNHSWFNLANGNFNLGKNIFFESPGIFINQDVIPIDKDIIKEIYFKEKISIKDIISFIIQNKHNDITTMYYLILNRKKRNKENSISDISHNSKQFLLYIKSSISKMHYWNNDIKKIINYYSLEIEKYINGKENEKFIDPAFNSEIKNILEENINENLPSFNLNTITNLNFNIIESNNGGNESDIETKKEFESINQSKSYCNSIQNNLIDSKIFANDSSEEPSINSINKISLKSHFYIPKNKECNFENENFSNLKTFENNDLKSKRTITESENLNDDINNNNTIISSVNITNNDDNGNKNLINNPFEINWRIKRNKIKNNKNNKSIFKHVDLKIEPQFYKKIPIIRKNQINKFINKKENSEIENGIKGNNIINKQKKIKNKTILTEPNSLEKNKQIIKDNNNYRPKSVETENIENKRIKTENLVQKSNFNRFYNLINKIRNINYQKNNIKYQNNIIKRKKKEYHSISFDNSIQKISKINSIYVNEYKKNAKVFSIEKKKILNHSIDDKQKIIIKKKDINSKNKNYQINHINKRNNLLSSLNRNKHFSQEPNSYRNELSSLTFKRNNGNSLILQTTSNEIVNKKNNYKDFINRNQNGKKLDKFLTKNNHQNIIQKFSFNKNINYNINNSDKKKNSLPKNLLNNNSNYGKIKGYKHNYLLKEKELIERNQKKIHLNLEKKSNDLIKKKNV